MPKFYFTYGFDTRYPFFGGWTEIEAPRQSDACTIFKMYHPDRPNSAGRLNCSGIFTESEFRDNKAYVDAHCGRGCREIITLTRVTPVSKSEAT